MGTRQALRVGVWMVVWGNRARPRPVDCPAVLLDVRVPLRPGQGAGPCPPAIDACWQAHRHAGYVVAWHLEAAPPRRWALATKQRVRRRRLWRRLLRRYPLFVATFYAEAVAAKPDYYGTPQVGEFADLEPDRATGRRCVRR